MPIKDYSTIAANNTLAPPNGAPEGMAAGLVNNTIRQVMADTRSFYESGGWCDLGHVPTYVSATSFTIPTDVTAYYTVGRRIRFYGTIMGTFYGFITASVYSSPNTTVTVVLDSGALTSNLSRVDLVFLDENANSFANNSVTNAKMATMPANTVKANATASSATPQDLALSTNTLLGRGASNLVALSLSSNLVISGSTLNVTGGLLTGVQVFTASGTYTPSARTNSAFIIITGGGGGGASGGAGGSSSISGGTTTLTANGGSAGNGILGGASGGGSGGNVLQGGMGYTGCNDANSGVLGDAGGSGGASYWGGGGRGGAASSAGAVAGQAWGSGGGGQGTDNNPLGGGGAGGTVISYQSVSGSCTVTIGAAGTGSGNSAAGMSGVCWIWEYS